MLPEDGHTMDNRFLGPGIPAEGFSVSPIENAALRAACEKAER